MPATLQPRSLLTEPVFPPSAKAVYQQADRTLGPAAAAGTQSWEGGNRVTQSKTSPWPQLFLRGTQHAVCSEDVSVLDEQHSEGHGGHCAAR